LGLAAGLWAISLYHGEGLRGLTKRVRVPLPTDDWVGRALLNHADIWRLEGHSLRTLFKTLIDLNQGSVLHVQVNILLLLVLP